MFRNMVKLVILSLLLMAATGVFGQSSYRLNDASKAVDVRLDFGSCPVGPGNGNCGPLIVEFFRKKAAKPFQSVRIPVTSSWDYPPKANVTRRYDEQSIINFGDFNFDGKDDVAICDGTMGGYGMPSYRVYLYNAAQKRFVYSRPFTRMNDGGLGMFETDQKKRMHYVFTKSGCCYHQTQGFDVLNGKPRKIYEFTEDVPGYKPEIVEIITSKFIGGKWRTWIKHAKTSEYYQ